MLQLRSPSLQIKQAAFAATAATVAKTPFIQNAHVFIPINSADAAEQSNHVYESEVSDAPKTAAEAWAVGDVIKFDGTAGEFNKTTGTACGFALAPALAAAVVSPLFLFKSF